MDRLEQAVAKGIITEAQRRDILNLSGAEPEATEQSEFRFSLVHLLWVAGVVLVLVALFILGTELVDDANSLLVVTLVYGAGFLALDQVIKARPGLRLLSSLLFIGVAVCGMIAVIALQYINGSPKPLGEAVESAFAHQADPYSGGRLVDYLFYSMAPVALVPLLIGAGLLMWRGFLAAWLIAVPAMFFFGIETLNFFIFQSDVFDVLDWTDTYVLIFGLLCFGLGWRLDLVSRLNHGFWLNKLAVFILGAWLLFQYEFEDRQNLVLALSILLIFVAIYLRRPFGVPVGAGFVVLYILELFDWWDDPLVLAAFLAVIGAILIYWGVRAHLIENRLEAMLPALLRRLRPARRSDPVTFGY